MAALLVPRVPSSRPRGRIAFIRTFVRNPLETLPPAVYEEDFVPVGGSKSPRAYIAAPALLKAVLLDQRDTFQKITNIRLLRPALGKGILTSEGSDWKWQRQAAAPMFRPQDLGAFVPAFVRAAEVTLARWRAAPADAVHDIEADMRRVTLDVIASTLLPSADEGFTRTVQRSVLDLQRSSAWGILFVSMNLPLWLPRPGILAGRRAVKTLRGTVGELLREVRARRESKHEEPDDLLRRLMAARDPETGRAMDDEQLVDNLLTFYLAGHETTAKALAWTLYLLARSGEWTARLEEEIDRVTGGEAIRAGHLAQLVLVQQVIKEAMRLFPPVPLMSRQAVADTAIGDHAIKAGTSILMSIYAIQRHSKRWERPDEFDPTRFAPQGEAAIARYQYMPFGAGPRICIGMAFAMMEATAILATLLQRARFAWAGSADPVPVAQVTLIPRGGMPMRIAER